MVKAIDIVVLVCLAEKRGRWTFRSFAQEIGVDHAALHRSVSRLKAAGLLDEDNRVLRSSALEFLVHAVRYLVPARSGEIERGIATAWSAEPLKGLLAPQAEPGPVWPDPEGYDRGPSLEPITPLVPEIARANPELHEWFALVDGIRLGTARDRKLAEEELSRRVWDRSERDS